MDDMERDGIAEWDGIRNYQARNFLKAMKKGDHCLYYHSNTKKTRPGIVGLVTVSQLFLVKFGCNVRLKSLNFVMYR